MWFTLRSGEISVGYGKLLRGVYAGIALIGVALGFAFDRMPVREAAGVGLAVVALCKAIFQSGIGLTDDVAFGKLALAINTYMNTNFELENGVPASGFNFFISFNLYHKGTHTEFFALITVFYNTVEKIYTQ